MSRSFDGVDDIIQATITDVTDGDWTAGGWIYPNSQGEGGNGSVFRTPGFTLRFVSAVATMRGVQTYSVSGASTDMATPPPNGAWTCLFAVHTASDDTVRLYTGDLDTAMAEAVYMAANPVLGVGTFTASGTTANIGNTSGASATWDGRLSRLAVDARAWTLAEMEAFRLGDMPTRVANLRGFWPLDSPTASQAEDLSGQGANGTVTGCTVAENPPIPTWGGVDPSRVLVVSTAGLSIPVAMASYRRRRI